jgi:predicted ATPase
MLRAKELITDSTDASQRLSIFYGLWACYYVSGEVALQQVAAADFLVEAEHYADPATLSLAHRTMGTTHVTMGEFASARVHLEKARALYDPERDLRFRFKFGQDIGATVLCYLSWALWHLGYLDQAVKAAAEAVARAREISHPHTLVYTLAHAHGMMDIFRRRSEDTRSCAGEVMSLCSEHGFPFWAAGGRILDGWALAQRGEIGRGIETMHEGLIAWRKTGARLWLPIFLALEAEAYANIGQHRTAAHAVEQAITTSDETGERWALAEALRIKARILRAAGGHPVAEVESLLSNSLEIARRQRALCWQLRISCDLAQLWREQSRTNDALELVRSVYEQFTEGFEAADLQHAKALIDTLEREAGHSPEFDGKQQPAVTGPV